MTDHRVASTDEVGEGEHVVIELKGVEVGVFNVSGEYFAHASWCPHQGGPVCEGALMGTTDAEYDPEKPGFELSWVKDGEVLRCPWHAWEFDVRSGESLHDASLGLVSYPTRVEDGNVVVSL